MAKSKNSQLALFESQKKTLTLNPPLNERFELLRVEEMVNKTAKTEDFFLNHKNVVELLALKRLENYTSDSDMFVGSHLAGKETEETRSHLRKLLYAVVRKDLWYSTLSSPFTVYSRYRTEMLIDALISATLSMIKSEFSDDILYNHDRKTYLKYFMDYNPSEIPPVTVQGRVSRGVED